jgi:hypothetical protein
MRYLLIDAHNGHEDGFDEGWMTFNSMDEVQKYLDDNAAEYADDRYSFEKWERGIELFEVGSKIAVNIAIKTEVKIGTDRTDIPAPLPGETVGDYARRISGG